MHPSRRFASFAALPMLAILTTLATLPGLANAGVPQVVTDMPVVQSLVAQVMGELGSPAVLLEQGADLHSFQLRPSHARAVADADLLFWVGPELTPWLERAIGTIGIKGHAVALLHAPAVNRIATSDRPLGEAGALADPEPASPAALDPHAWLDPGNARVWIAAIAAELARTDPGNAATYSANAAVADARVARLDARIKATLAPVGAAPIIVYHDAYGYFAAHFGVNIVGEIELGDASAPSAAKLAALRDVLAAQGAVCIFPEAQHDPRLLVSLVAGTGVKIGPPVDPEGTTLPYGPGLYGDLLTALASAIESCVTGP